MNRLRFLHKKILNCFLHEAFNAITWCNKGTKLSLRVYQFESVCSFVLTFRHFIFTILKKHFFKFRVVLKL